MASSSLLGTDQLPSVMPTQDEKTVALIAHIVTLVSNFIAPLIIYLVKKDESTFVREHAKESLNFQLTVCIVAILLVITIVGVLLLWIVAIYAMVLVVVGTIKASEGKLYRYPFSIRFIK
ncbi:MAG TPA: DUF4870 domain-containing protein [Chitinophagaceae bacterium]|nr:DUF4870 domain-containing protein [Chitinophagaceae bacterium]